MKSYIPIKTPVIGVLLSSVSIQYIPSFKVCGISRMEQVGVALSGNLPETTPPCQLLDPPT